MIFYGLKTCDTCRKARKALDAAGVDYTYRDVRGDDGYGAVSAADVGRWAGAAAASEKPGWERLLNKSSATWRELDDADKADMGEAKAIALMADHPTLIKRPVIEADGAVHVGWTQETQDALGV